MTPRPPTPGERVYRVGPNREWLLHLPAVYAVNPTGCRVILARVEAMLRHGVHTELPAGVWLEVVSAAEVSRQS